MPPRPRRPRRIEYSDDDKTNSSRAALPVSDSSYRESPVVGLESSQASLGKRLASVAGLDGSPGKHPTDFKFLFHRTSPEEPSREEPSEPEAKSRRKGDEESPDTVEDDEHLWVRTEVRKGSDLIDGQAWMAEFQVRVGAHLEKAAGDPLQPGPNFFLRNRVLREMGKTCPPGKRLRLPTGQDVIFWFNVGIPGPPKSRVYVTEARCPHQGVCLLGGELSEIEDEMGIAQAMIRCPRHNKTFSLRHGRSHGNTEVLREFPCRFMHGHWYVGLDLDEPGTPAAASSFKEPLSPGSEGKAGRPTLQCTEAQDSSPSSDPTRKKLRWLFDTLQQ
mmetsp:Transcript_78982/g.142500  ORF Transcript_78982/g.142500 Transcript_78982/m.142500 type:complete len:331 (+) Transcript_78982:44-1036(+)